MRTRSKRFSAAIFGGIDHHVTLAHDRWRALFVAGAHREAQRRAGLRDGESYLEAGVAVGRTFVPMVLRNPTGRNEGIDRSETRLELCRRRLSQHGATNFALRAGEPWDLPYDDESFDLVLSCGLLDDVPRARLSAALRQFHRVLKDGGRLVVLCYGRGMTLVDKTSARLRPSAAELAPVELGRQLLRSGFRDVSCRAIGRYFLKPELVRAVKIKDDRWFNLTRR